MEGKLGDRPTLQTSRNSLFLGFFSPRLLFKGLGARPGITYRLRLPNDRLTF
jgi:hypothetical protein